MKKQSVSMSILIMLCIAFLSFPLAYAEIYDWTKILNLITTEPIGLVEFGGGILSQVDQGLLNQIVILQSLFMLMEIGELG
ncbi:MAG: hypothetical protein NDF55_10035 [archaeon GB-1867-005]|nr:hypothetical protein [Candidatus Culexmicrobium cathedralense]